MANVQYPQAPLPPPAASGNSFPLPNNNSPPQWSRPGFTNCGPPTERLAGMKIDSNLHRTRTSIAGTYSTPNENTQIKYEGVILKKDPNPPYGVEPSWSRVKETPLVATNEELAKTVKKKGKDNVSKELSKLKSENQRMQIDELLADRNHAEWNQNVEWILAMVDEERGPGKKPNETETKALNIVLKRQPKIKSQKEAKSRRASTPAADIPGIVRDLNSPNWQGQGRSNGPNQAHQPNTSRPSAPFPLSGPASYLGGQAGNQSGPPPGMGHQMGMPPPDSYSHQPPRNGYPSANMAPPDQVKAFQNLVNINQQPMSVPPRPNFPPPPPPPQQQRQQQQQQQPPAPPPPPPISIPVPIQPLQGPKSNRNRKEDDDDIVQIIGNSPQKDRKSRSRTGSTNQIQGPRSILIGGKNSNVSFAGTSSDDDDSSHWSHISDDYTNITTPTSGTGSSSRGDLKGSHSGRGRRSSGIDYMADLRDYRVSPRERRDSTALSDDFLDDYVDLGPRRTLSRSRDTRGSQGSHSPHPRARDRLASDALYKPTRRPTAAELLEEEYLLKLERLRREEDFRLEQTLRERDLYERERARRERSPSRFDQGITRSSSRPARRY